MHASLKWEPPSLSGRRCQPYPWPCTTSGGQRRGGCQSFRESVVGWVCDHWRPLEALGDLETLGGRWRPLEAVGGLWRLLETLGDSWRLLETLGDHWRPLETIGDLFRSHPKMYLHTITWCMTSINLIFMVWAHNFAPWTPPPSKKIWTLFSARSTNSKRDKLGKRSIIFPSSKRYAIH